ncbi:Uncharacterized protein dnm_029000 [Desulfonema magnum]|uniref:Uncharacterized protein n=1 Tax=Desulfonema magnum TaxID=45655 RepID=A0A975BKP6_9BACT|nr:Uncharacterized protein dnm_029000 [Desulfonema magnum]
MRINLLFLLKIFRKEFYAKADFKNVTQKYCDTESTVNVLKRHA